MEVHCAISPVMPPVPVTNHENSAAKLMNVGPHTYCCYNWCDGDIYREDLGTGGEKQLVQTDPTHAWNDKGTEELSLLFEWTGKQGVYRITFKKGGKHVKVIEEFTVPRGTQLYPFVAFGGFKGQEFKTLLA